LDLVFGDSASVKYSNIEWCLETHVELFTGTLTRNVHVPEGDSIFRGEQGGKIKRGDLKKHTRIKNSTSESTGLVH